MNSDQGEGSKPEQTEQRLAGQPEFKMVDLIDSWRRDDAIDQFSDMPTSFTSLEDVRAYLRDLGSEHRRQVVTRNASSQESLTARNLLATMYEQIAESPAEKIGDFIQRQKGVVDEKLALVRAQIGLLLPSAELIERLKTIPQWPQADLAFNEGFLLEAQNPNFYNKVLGNDFIKATTGNLDNLNRERGDLEGVSSKWQQAIDITKPPTPGGVSTNSALPSGK